MNIHNKDQFAETFNNLDATDSPEQIRNAIDQDQHMEMLNEKTGRWYSVENGELKQVEEL